MWSGCRDKREQISQVQVLHLLLLFRHVFVRFSKFHVHFWFFVWVDLYEYVTHVDRRLY
jgi:hypothetical protein